MTQQAKYHAKCLANLYNRGNQAKHQNLVEEQSICKSIALAELISYIEDCKYESEMRSLRLADLVELYKDRLEQLGEDVPERINSTHLKERILWHLPELQAYDKGRDVFLAFNEDIGSLLCTDYFDDLDQQSMMMVKVAKTIRNDIFSRNVSFDGSFNHESQVNSVPQSLLTLIGMIVNGPNIKEQSASKDIGQSVLSAAQLLVFNSVKRRRCTSDASRIYHKKERQTPLPTYVGFKVHALTRNKQLIDTLYSLGISDHYGNIMDTIAAMGNRISEYYNDINVVCPPQLKTGLFVTAAADNIDHNPSSTTSTGSFHGTGLTLFQNTDIHTVSSSSDRGFDKHITLVKHQRQIADLPKYYTNIKPTRLPHGDVYVPNISEIAHATTDFLAKSGTDNDSTANELKWLTHVQKLYSEADAQKTKLFVTKETNLSWAAYHASTLEQSSITPSINAMLPLFPDEANSPSMMRHCLDIVKAAVQHINPGQTPVISVDQPLFAKMKQIQWSMPASHGEDKFVILLGGFHIEWTLYKLLGNWLEGSGWAETLAQADIAGNGTAESFLSAAHVLKTRNAHQVTACSLYILMKSSYQDYLANNITADDPVDFNAWCIRQKEENPQFLYWFTTLELELLALALVHSFRTGNFQLYLDTLLRIAPWFFSMNNVHYARWVPVHVRDMITLEANHPDIAAEFKKRKFTVIKTNKRFSGLAIDQAHEQNNEVMKGDGGFIGLTQDEKSLLKWAVAGPEIVRVISEFESSLVNRPSELKGTASHHDETKATQQRLNTQIEALVTQLKDAGNPFGCENTSLTRPHTRELMDGTSVDCLRSIKQKGNDQYATFVTERLIEQTKAITDPITRNSVFLFHERTVKTKTKQQELVSQLKNESSLFSKLYVACQKREGDLDTFFAHENQPYPPSLSSCGKLRQGKKSDLLECLEPLAPSTSQDTPPTDVTVIDGAAVVNMLKPTGCKTFSDYTDRIFGVYVTTELTHTCRVDIVWDQHKENSLKGQTREKRSGGKALRRKVEKDTPLPSRWQEFLRVDDNKTELFALLSNTIR